MDGDRDLDGDENRSDLVLPGVLSTAGGVLRTTGLCADGGVIVFGTLGVPAEPEAGCLGCTVISRRAAMRSTMDLRVVPLLTEVSGADDRGVARLRVLGVSTRVLPLWPPIELETLRSGDLERLPDEDDSFRGAVKTPSDRGRLEGVHLVLESRADSRLGAGAATDGVDLLENGLERIVAGGLLGVNDGREGAIERGALGVNDGREGAIERGALGVNDGLEGAADGGLNDGLEGAIEGDLPELNGDP